MPCADKGKQYACTAAGVGMAFKIAEAIFLIVRLQKLKNQIASHCHCFLAFGLCRALVS